jgi:hypothetical protein
VLVSFYFFMTQYLQGVSDLTPLEAGLAFLPVTAAAFAAATLTSRLSRRLGNDLVAVAGVAAMLIGTAWASRVGPTPATWPASRSPCSSSASGRASASAR